MASNKPEVSIIIPSYNRGNVLVDTVNQVLNQKYNSFELLVVDQTDDKKYDVSSKLNKILDSRLRVFYVSPNSLTAARNFGLSKAKGKIVIFIDDDVKIKNNFIEEHVKNHKNGVVAVAGKVTQKNHPKYDYPVYFDKYGFQHGLFNSNKDSDISTFPGGNVSINKKKAIEAGGFDSSFTGSAIREESEFAYRLSKMGKIVYRPSANLIHLAIPFGGCRIYTHQYDNLEFYYNDFRFVFKTLNYITILPALYKRFRRYCFERKRPTVVLKRISVFILALAISLKRLVLPVKVMLKEISK